MVWSLVKDSCSSTYDLGGCAACNHGSSIDCPRSYQVLRPEELCRTHPSSCSENIHTFPLSPRSKTKTAKIGKRIGTCGAIQMDKASWSKGNWDRNTDSDHARHRKVQNGPTFCNLIAFTWWQNPTSFNQFVQNQLCKWNEITNYSRRLILVRKVLVIIPCHLSLLSRKYQSETIQKAHT